MSTLDLWTFAVEGFDGQFWQTLGVFHGTFDEAGKDAEKLFEEWANEVPETYLRISKSQFRGDSKRERNLRLSEDEK